MANEADVVELSGMNPIRFTCDSATAISKGTLLNLSSDPHTVTASSGVDVYAGVAAADKVTTNGDTSTEISVHVPNSNNVFDMKCSTAEVTLGALVVLSGANLIRDAVTTEVEEGKVIGQALETGDASEVIRVRS